MPRLKPLLRLNLNILLLHLCLQQAQMKQTGEPTNKMSVWLKARNLEDHDVIYARNEYQAALDKEPEDQRQLTSVKDKIFHRIMGNDGHGYCRTYGSGVPPVYVYPHDPSVPNSTAELINKITEQVTKKLSDEYNEKQEILTRQWGMKYDEMVSRINELESNQGGTTNPHVSVSSTYLIP